MIHEKEVLLDAPVSMNLMIIHETPPLPLDMLFSVDRSSPYYNEVNKTPH